MSLAARTVRPRRSNCAKISPARLRATASGLARISVCSTAMRRARLPGLPAPRRSLLRLAENGRRRRVVLDGRLAVRTDLPQGFERLVALHARLTQLRRA